MAKLSNIDEKESDEKIPLPKRDENESDEKVDENESDEKMPGLACTINFYAGPTLSIHDAKAKENLRIVWAIIPATTTRPVIPAVL